MSGSVSVCRIVRHIDFLGLTGLSRHHFAGCRASLVGHVMCTVMHVLHGVRHAGCMRVFGLVHWARGTGRFGCESGMGACADQCGERESEQLIHDDFLQIWIRQAAGVSASRENAGLLHTGVSRQKGTNQRLEGGRDGVSSEMLEKAIAGIDR